MDIDLTLQEGEPTELLTLIVESAFGVTLSLGGIEPPEFFPVESGGPLSVTLTLQSIDEPRDYQPISYNQGPVSEAPYAEVSRSSSTQTIYGSDPGLFKFNPAASTYRRGGPSHVIHLGPVKPPVVTLDILFQVVTPFADIAPFEFYYKAPGGYLEIWNDVTIQSSLVPDGNTAAIPIQIRPLLDVFPQVVVTSFDLPRTLL